MTEERLAGAAAVLLLYATLVIGVVLQQRRRRLQAERDAAALMPAADGMAPVLVAYASQTGHAEELAWQTARALHTAGLPALLKPLGDIAEEDLRRSERALFIVSTYGEGDPPDGAAAFARDVMTDAAPLPRLQHAVLALGDREYANFCGFGRRLDDWLRERGATPLFDRIEVDNHEATALQAWQQQLGRLAGTADLPEWQAPAFAPWRLAARRWLNPGSSGGPVYLIDLEPTGNPAAWEAGDLVQVLAPADRERPREYSVASALPGGPLQLLVRQERHPDGTVGVASGWLTEGAAVGEAIELRVRAHRHFRIGDNAARPLVLIGNGTGYAGLRAHLQARAAQAEAPPCWLLFGERQAIHDRYCGDEIVDWLERGVLARADLVYSRDQAERRYVQHRLLEEGDRLRAWVARGAAIYVCGSLQGMAGGVDAALRGLLGESQVDRLVSEGRYRRDVY